MDPSSLAKRLVSSQYDTYKTTYPPFYKGSLGHIKKIVGDRPLIFPNIGRAVFFIFYSCLNSFIRNSERIHAKLCSGYEIKQNFDKTQYK